MLINSDCSFVLSPLWIRN